MDPAAVTEIVSRQLRLEGTLTLNSETAKKNGGDYDFDWICVVKGHGSRCSSRIGSGTHHPGRIRKTSKTRKNPRGGTCRRSRNSAKGNAIGAITTSKHRAWRQAGPISRTLRRSNCRRHSTNSNEGVEPNQRGDLDKNYARKLATGSVAEAQRVSGSPISLAGSDRPNRQDRRTLQPRPERTARVLCRRATGSRTSAAPSAEAPYDRGHAEGGQA